MPYERVSSPTDVDPQESARRAPASRLVWFLAIVLGIVAVVLRIDERVLPLLGVAALGVMLLLDRIVERRRRALVGVQGEDASDREDADSGARRSDPVSRFWWFGALALAIVAFVADLALPLLTSLVLLLFAVLLLADAMLARRGAIHRSGGPIAPHLWAVLLVLAAAQWVLRLDWWVAVIAVVAIGLLDAALARRTPQPSRA